MFATLLLFYVALRIDHSYLAITSATTAGKYMHGKALQSIDRTNTFIYLFLICIFRSSRSVFIYLMNACKVVTTNRLLKISDL